MYCKHCGAQISEESKFCNKCGKELSSSATTQKEQNTVHANTEGTQQFTNSKLSSGSVCSIILTVATLLTLFMTWGTSRDYNLFRLISFCISSSGYTKSDTLNIVGYILAFLGLIPLVLHMLNLYMSVTKPGNNIFARASGLAAGAYVCIFYLLIAVVANLDVTIVPLICLVLSILQYLVGKHPGSD